MKTKRKYILSKTVLCCVLLLSASSVMAQTVEIGARLMPTFSSFDLKNSEGGEVKGKATLGYGAGAFVGFNFSEHVGVQVEVIYASISQKYSEKDFDRRVTLKYVNIPILLSLNTGKAQAFNFNMVLGPQIGLNAGSSVKTTGGNGQYQTQAVLAVKKSDLGFAYGAGFDFGINELNSIRIGIGYRGVLGLVDISDDNNNLNTESYYVLDKSKIKTNAAYAGISLMF